jgi:hypothetical protein
MQSCYTGMALRNLQSYFTKGTTELATECATNWTLQSKVQIHDYFLILMMWREPRINKWQLGINIKAWRTCGTREGCAQDARHAFNSC